MTTDIKLPNIPTATDFLKSVREDESVIIQKISDKFINNLKASLNQNSFQFDITDITKGYKLHELEYLVAQLFDSYKANGYVLEYTIKESIIYYAKFISISIHNFSFITPPKQIVVDPPPSYTTISLPETLNQKKKSHKHKFWRLCF